MKKEQNRLVWFKQPFVIFIFWILILLIIGQTYFVDIAFLLTPFVIIGIGIYSIIIGIEYFRKYNNKLLGFFNLGLGILIILLIIFLIKVLLVTTFSGSNDNLPINDPKYQKKLGEALENSGLNESTEPLAIKIVEGYVNQHLERYNMDIKIKNISLRKVDSFNSYEANVTFFNSSQYPKVYDIRVYFDSGITNMYIDGYDAPPNNYGDPIEFNGCVADAEKECAITSWHKVLYCSDDHTRDIYDKDSELEERFDCSCEGKCKIKFSASLNRTENGKLIVSVDSPNPLPELTIKKGNSLTGDECTFVAEDLDSGINEIVTDCDFSECVKLSYKGIRITEFNCPYRY